MVALFLAYILALWLGVYLLARDFKSPQLRWTGLGLVAYALALSIQILETHTPDPGARRLVAAIGRTFLFTPAAFWTGALVYLLPEQEPLRPKLVLAWRTVQLPLAAALLVIGWLTASGEVLPAGSASHFALALVLTVPLIALLFWLVRAGLIIGPQVPVGLTLVATLFFILGTGLMFFSASWIPRNWLVLAIGGDLALLGYAIGRLDAFERGEAWRPDFLRSLVYISFTILAFAAPVTLTIYLGPGPTLEMVALLLFMILVAIVMPLLADPIQSVLDRLAFAGIPGLFEQRASFRAAASAASRANQRLDLQRMSEGDFTHLTRRALSQYGNLPRLAASPLIRLRQVEARLASRGVPDDTLARAMELKALLQDAIHHLKPRGEAEFGTTDEWRFYNALYFPYVRGLRPYSRRADHDGQDTVDRQALNWFRSQVPGRTLYNWQSSAATLVARYLREQEGEY